VIRDAQPADCSALSALAFASKAHWGYDDAFMEACREELTVRPAQLDTWRVRVAGELDGFHAVSPDGELQMLFVAPAAMGAGVGAALFADACTIAREFGATELYIEADPFAAAFYEHMGARRIGEVPSVSIPRRVLPAYRIGLSSNV
jgi:GNAT superfamily N-acetyltransferase